MADLEEFDRPIFKKLSHNDTGAAVGHQAGVVIPQQLDQFFPQLSGLVTTADPTPSEDIRAQLFVGNDPVGVVATRYQYQTWGGTRSPERRITGNLTSLRNQAAEGDYLVIERSISDEHLYRLRLLKAGTPAYADIERKAAGRRWGAVNIHDLPAAETAVQTALEEQEAHESSPLNLFDNDAALLESHSTKVARSRAFQRRVSTLYDFRCAVCGKGFRTPAGLFEVEAAHIVPRGLKGADDARNGFALCRSHHWAFDRGLFGVDHEGRIKVPSKVSVLPDNSDLSAFHSLGLRSPSDPIMSPAPEAFAWHMQNIVEAG